MREKKWASTSKTPSTAITKIKGDLHAKVANGLQEEARPLQIIELHGSTDATEGLTADIIGFRDNCRIHIQKLQTNEIIVIRGS